MRVSFVLFDEIEKASDALWNLLLGILDKATLTLGDNRRVDFSQAMIFMTSNLGASEWVIMQPNLGFAASEIEEGATASRCALTDKISRAGSKPRGANSPSSGRIADGGLPPARRAARESLGLNILQQRIFNSSTGAPFVFRDHAARTTCWSAPIEVRRPL
jgi:hypothetical protein